MQLPSRCLEVSIVKKKFDGSRSYRAAIEETETFSMD